MNWTPAQANAIANELLLIIESLNRYLKLGRKGAEAQLQIVRAVLKHALNSAYAKNDKEIEHALQEIYDNLISKSWKNADVFHVYQDAWETVEKAFNVSVTSDRKVVCNNAS